MSKLEMIEMEITRRQEATAALNLAIPDLLKAIEQFNKLDEMYRSDEKTARVALEGIYREDRHFTGKQPLVYSSIQTEFYPFFQGPADTQCNPYFPITKVQDKTFDGLSPLYVGPTKTGVYARDANYSPVEAPIRNSAMIALQAFPDISGETGAGSCTGETPPGSGTNESLCLANGGTWVPPVYGPGSTATEKLRNALNPWKTKVNEIIADLYSNTGSVELIYWQNIVTKIDTILAAIQVDVIYPSKTLDFAPNSAEDLARDYLIANISSINTHTVDRSAYLAKEANIEEQVFFGVIKLRLHQANGSFAKLKAAKSQIVTNKSLIEDNVAAISSLNLLKVKAS